MKKISAFLLTFSFILLFSASEANAQTAMTATKPAVMKPVANSTAPAPMVATSVAPTMTITPMTAAEPTMAAVPAPVTKTTTTATTSTKKDSKGSIIGGGLLEIFIYIIGCVLIALKGVLIRWLWEKYKLEKYVSADKVDEMVEKAVVKGVNYADEQAHKLRDNPIDGAKKLDLAIDAAKKYIKDSGLPEKGASYLATLIEAKLPELRTANGTVKKEEDPVTAEDTVKTEEKPKETNG